MDCVKAKLKVIVTANDVTVAESEDVRLWQQVFAEILLANEAKVNAEAEFELDNPQSFAA